MDKIRAVMRPKAIALIFVVVLLCVGGAVYFFVGRDDEGNRIDTIPVTDITSEDPALIENLRNNQSDTDFLFEGDDQAFTGNLVDAEAQDEASQAVRAILEKCINQADPACFDMPGTTVEASSKEYQLAYYFNYGTVLFETNPELAKENFNKALAIVDGVESEGIDRQLIEEWLNR